MGFISKLQKASLAAALVGTQLREQKGEVPDVGTKHGRNYRSLRHAFEAFSEGDRQATLASLAEVEDWDWVDAKFQVAVNHRSTTVRRGQLQGYLTELARNGDLAHAEAIHFAALAVLADHHKTR